jgi:G3E family GTPase
MVGLVENALIEIRDTMSPDRIIIESRRVRRELRHLFLKTVLTDCSGSAFPATLALQIREIEPKGFKLDGVVTVIDCVNFRGYEDSSPSAKVSELRAL